MLSLYKHTFLFARLSFLNFIFIFPAAPDPEYLQTVPLHFLPPVQYLSAPPLPEAVPSDADADYTEVPQDKSPCKGPDNKAPRDITAEMKMPDCPEYKDLEDMKDLRCLSCG